MANTMKAVRFHGKKDLRYEDIPVPDVKKGQVKLKPKFVGICGSDLHEYLDGPSLCPTSPHPITGEKVPLTFGHEFSGIVEEVGEGVTKYKKGDRVVVQPIIYDKTCGACKAEQINCCYKGGFVGLSGWGGGLSEHVVLDQDMLYHLPENITLEIGGANEPLLFF
jgi:threonine dehydrogenase-like Zn-dependent dehydrogenase